jgi:hypothetical protein
VPEQHRHVSSIQRSTIQYLDMLAALRSDANLTAQFNSDTSLRLELEVPAHTENRDQVAIILKARLAKNW